MVVLSISCPKIFAEPLDGINNPKSVRIKVDFPAPFGPMNP